MNLWLLEGAVRVWDDILPYAPIGVYDEESLADDARKVFLEIHPGSNTLITVIELNVPI